MDIATRAARAVAFVAETSLLLILGSGIANAQTMTGGMMGNWSMGGFGWGSFAVVLVVVLLVVLVSFVAGKK